MYIFKIVWIIVILLFAISGTVSAVDTHLRNYLFTEDHEQILKRLLAGMLLQLEEELQKLGEDLKGAFIEILKPLKNSTITEKTLKALFTAQVSQEKVKKIFKLIEMFREKYIEKILLRGEVERYINLAANEKDSPGRGLCYWVNIRLYEAAKELELPAEFEVLFDNREEEVERPEEEVEQIFDSQKRPIHAVVLIEVQGIFSDYLDYIALDAVGGQYISKNIRRIVIKSWWSYKCELMEAFERKENKLTAERKEYLNKEFSERGRKLFLDKLKALERTISDNLMKVRITSSSL